MKIVGKLNIWKDSIHVCIAVDWNQELSSANTVSKHRHM